MAFPSNTGSVTMTLEAAWAQARQTAAWIKNNAQNLAAAAQAGPVSADRITAFAAFLAQSNTVLSQCAQVSGIAAYAQAQVSNPTLDVAAAFSAMQNAVIATGAWIIANFPKDANGNLLYVKFDGAGNTVYATFTSAQLAGLVTQLNALIATID